VVKAAWSIPLDPRIPGLNVLLKPASDKHGVCCWIHSSVTGVYCGSRMGDVLRGEYETGRVKQTGRISRWRRVALAHSSFESFPMVSVEFHNATVCAARAVWVINAIQLSVRILGHNFLLPKSLFEPKGLNRE
jgi:hypothetical protein